MFAEIVVIVLLLLPFISNKIWNQLFKSRFLIRLESLLLPCFAVLVAILVLFFIDAWRDMNKYDEAYTHSEGLKTHVDAQTQAHMNKFRAERNFFVSGFTLFLCLVIKQVVNLISDNANLQEKIEIRDKQLSLLVGSDGEAKELMEVSDVAVMNGENDD